mmetsp:Transcript_27937/g.62187  ORF Transcript_27937/g.62187 Transcript_27937/m.62187 type:complete len:415 (-) Transcript_27937:486-1730(-)
MLKMYSGAFPKLNSQIPVDDSRQPGPGDYLASCKMILKKNCFALIVLVLVGAAATAKDIAIATLRSGSSALSSSKASTSAASRPRNVNLNVNKAVVATRKTAEIDAEYDRHLRRRALRRTSTEDLFVDFVDDADRRRLQLRTIPSGPFTEYPYRCTGSNSREEAVDVTLDCPSDDYVPYCIGNPLNSSNTCDTTGPSACCIGETACEEFSGCVKKGDPNASPSTAGCHGYSACETAVIPVVDNSCIGSEACILANMLGALYSCIGKKSCFFAGGNGGSLGNLFQSCQANSACYFAGIGDDDVKREVGDMTGSCNDPTTPCSNKTTRLDTGGADLTCCQAVKRVNGTDRCSVASSCGTACSATESEFTCDGLFVNATQGGTCLADTPSSPSSHHPLSITIIIIIIIIPLWTTCFS